MVNPVRKSGRGFETLPNNLFPSFNSARKNEAFSNGVKKFPSWLKQGVSEGGAAAWTRRVLRDLGLLTICETARCPNINECFSERTATFLILGDICTRSCRFCAVKTGKPKNIDSNEPKKIAEAVRKLGLKYVVITSVTRDDLADGGSSHFAAVIDELRREFSGVVIEVLTPDFGGSMRAIRIVVKARPHVFGHNLDTVPRLYGMARPQASYTRSLSLLETVKNQRGDIYTKSGLMVGLGETKKEVFGLMNDLRGVGCDILTIGQYLQPSKKKLTVSRFIHPDRFKEYRKKAYSLGFMHVESGPLVRSSYHADRAFRAASTNRDF